MNNKMGYSPIIQHSSSIGLHSFHETKINYSNVVYVREESPKMFSPNRQNNFLKTELFGMT